MITDRPKLTTKKAIYGMFSFHFTVRINSKLFPLTVCRVQERGAVCVEDSGGPTERRIAYSRPLRGEYCIVLIQHNTVI